MAGSKLVLEQHGVIGTVKAGEAKYEVVSLINRTRPLIGETLNEADVQKLKAETVGLTIEIKASKRSRK